MKNILIIADGILAKYFLDKVMNANLSIHQYTVITYRAKTSFIKYPENFIFFSFDPTSFVKLEASLSGHYHQAMILMGKKIDGMTTYENLRKINPKLQIFMMDLWGLENETIEDPNLNILDARQIISARFMDCFPDTPVIAQNIGLGIGEIMEIQVPIGSSFVYRHLSTIYQKKWRIVMIYRNGRYIFARPSLMIHPNDILLVVGEPAVLSNIFRGIKEETGQFPSPFGRNIYCFIDMKNMSKSQIEDLVNNSLLLHSKINSKSLQIKIINPRDFKLLKKLKSLTTKHIKVVVDYFNVSPNDIIQEDVVNLNIGLALVNISFFEKYKKLLYKTKIPIFKIGKSSFSDLKFGVILGKDSEEIEKESAVILDCCSQLNLEISLYYYDTHKATEESSLLEHFENISRLFDKKVEINQNNEQNPIVFLRKRKDLLQFIPFSEKITHKNHFAIFFTDMDKLYYKLADNYQLFIPTGVGQNDNNKTI